MLIFAKSIDSWQLSQSMQQQFFEYYTTRGLKMSIRFGIADIITEAFSPDIFNKRSITVLQPGVFCCKGYVSKF